eukprot:gene23654-28661_t
MAFCSPANPRLDDGGRRRIPQAPECPNTDDVHAAKKKAAKSNFRRDSTFFPEPDISDDESEGSIFVSSTPHSERWNFTFVPQCLKPTHVKRLVSARGVQTWVPVTICLSCENLTVENQRLQGVERNGEGENQIGAQVTRVKLDAIRKCEIVPFEKYELDCFSLAVNPAAASRGESDFVFSLYNRPGIQSTAKFWRAQIISAARRAGRRRALREAFTLLQDHYQSLRLEHILQDDACISAPNALDAIPESPNDQGGTEETGGIPMASEAMALVVQDPASGDESAALNQAFEEILAFPFESKEDLRWLEDTEGVSFLVSFLSQPWAMPYWPSCVGALRNVCSGSDDLKEYLVENDIIDTLLTILRTDGADKANALDLIRSLSRLPEPCRKLAEKGVINLIINVLKHPLSPSELAQGSTALQNLVTNSAENQSLLAFADHGIETVVQRFETGLDPTARLACLEILHSLSQSTSMTDLLLGKRVEDPLQRVAAGLNTKENPQMNLTLKLTLANLLANHESATTDQETAMQIVDAMSATLDGRLVGKTKYKLHSILTGVLNLVCAEKDTSALVDAGVLTLLLRTLRMTLSGECHYEETLRIKVQ